MFHCIQTVLKSIYLFSTYILIVTDMDIHVGGVLFVLPQQCNMSNI